MHFVLRSCAMNEMYHLVERILVGERYLRREEELTHVKFRLLAVRLIF
jgi:hypothetical protein